MKKDSSFYQRSAQELIHLVLESEGHVRIFEEFCAKEPKLRHQTFVKFCAEFVPSKLALGCVYWMGCCAHHRIDDKNLKNLFFKEVMKLFESPKSLENATRFSECLYASNADTEASPVLGVLVHLFHNLGLETIVKPGNEHSGELNAGFHFMMEVSEALKIAYETKFDEHYYSNTDNFLKSTECGRKA